MEFIPNLNTIPLDVVRIIAAKTYDDTTPHILRLVCKLFRTIKSSKLEDTHFLMSAAIHGNVNLAKWYQRHVARKGYKIYRTIDASVVAAYHGNLALVDWLYSVTDFTGDKTLTSDRIIYRYMSMVLIAAAAGNSIDVIRFAKQHMHSSSSWRNALTINQGPLANRGPPAPIKYAMCIACSNASKDALRYLLSECTQDERNNVMLNKTQGSVSLLTDVMVILRKYGCSCLGLPCVNLTSSALSAGNLQMFELVTNIYGAEYAADDCLKGIASGQLKVIEYLHRNGYDMRCNKTMLEALRSGSRDIILYMYSIGNVIGNSLASDFGNCVVRSGNLNLIKWSRGYNPDYLPFVPIPYSWDDIYTGIKSLEILRWMRGYNRDKDVQTAYTQTDIFQWKYSIYFYMQDITDDELEALQWLRSEGCPWGNAYFCHNSPRIKAWIHAQKDAPKCFCDHGW